MREPFALVPSACCVMPEGRPEGRPEGGGLGVQLAVGACTEAGAAVAEVGGHVKGKFAPGLLADWWCMDFLPARCKEMASWEGP